MQRWVIAMFVLIGSAQAQDAERTLGYFLDLGAKQLTAEQVRKAFSGRTQEFVNHNAEIRLTYEPDGSMHGSVRLLAFPHRVSRSEGTWLVRDDGSMCVDEWLADFKEAHQWCRYYFWMADGGRLISSESATDRDGRVMVRQSRARSD